VGVNPEKKAVLLDRHPLWLEALQRLLHSVGIDVVGKTTSALEAVQLVNKAKPDLFLADYDALDESAGLSTLERVRETHPDVRSVVLSASEDSNDINAAFAAGAAVYCVKTAAPEDLASAVRQAFRNSIYLSGAVSASAAAATSAVAKDESPGLTKREVEILQLVAEGYSNSQVAKMLWVTEQTVKFHLSNVYRKLDVSNRTEASRWAQVNGLLPTVPATTAAA
jgi:DNA-binding NarL/FixJ family response regulator